MGEDAPMSSAVDELVDRQDREYAAAVEDAGRQATIVASILRHRVSERLTTGDPVPAVTVLRLEPPGDVRFNELPAGRPVVLVFGSYT
jgi:hypothetical protein